MNHAVEIAELRDSLAHDLLHAPGVGHVGLQHQHLGAGLRQLRQLLQALPLRGGGRRIGDGLAPQVARRYLRTPHEHQPGLPFTGQVARQREADATQAAGDQVNALLPQPPALMAIAARRRLEHLLPSVRPPIGRQRGRFGGTGLGQHLPGQPGECRVIVHGHGHVDQLAGNVREFLRQHLARAVQHRLAGVQAFQAGHVLELAGDHRHAQSRAVAGNALAIQRLRQCEHAVEATRQHGLQRAVRIVRFQAPEVIDLTQGAVRRAGFSQHTRQVFARIGARTIVLRICNLEGRCALHHDDRPGRNSQLLQEGRTEVARVAEHEAIAGFGNFHRRL